MFKLIRQPQQTLNKITAFAVCFIFIVSSFVSPAMAAPAPFAQAQSKAEIDSAAILKNFSLPQDLGQIEEVYNPGSLPAGKPLVFYVQDAHAQADAQKNIAGMIHLLQTQYGLPLVLLEGGEGPLDSLFFRAFPDKERKEKILSEYIKNGELSGGEAASIFDDRFETRYMGIENQKLYDENKKVFLSVLSDEPKLTDLLNAEKLKLQKIFQAKLSPSALEFLKASGELRAEKMDLLQYAEIINRLAAQNPNSDKALIEKFPEIKKLLLVQSSKSAEKHSNDTAEGNALILEIERNWISKLDNPKQIHLNGLLQQYRTGAIDLGGFLLQAETIFSAANIRLQIPENLKSLTRPARVLASIEGTKLFDEIEAFEAVLRNLLARTPEEKKLLSQQHGLDLLGRFSRLELTPREWGEINPVLSYWPEWNQNFSAHRKFYELAQQRDQVLHENVNRAAAKEKAKIVLVVTGGFHARRVTELFRKEQTPFILLSPAIDTPGSRDNYLRVMRGEFSYKPKFKGNLWDALAEDYAAKMAASLNSRDLTPQLKTWRDRIIQNAIAEGSITRVGNYTKYVDALIQVVLQQFASDSPFKKLSEDEVRRQIQKELAAFTPNYFEKLRFSADSKIDLFGQGLEGMWKTGAITPSAVGDLLRQVTQVNSAQLSPDLVLIRDHQPIFYDSKIALPVLTDAELKTKMDVLINASGDTDLSELAAKLENYAAFQQAVQSVSPVPEEVRSLIDGLSPADIRRLAQGIQRQSRSEVRADYPGSDKFKAVLEALNAKDPSNQTYRWVDESVIEELQEIVEAFKSPEEVNAALRNITDHLEEFSQKFPKADKAAYARGFIPLYLPIMDRIDSKAYPALVDHLGFIWKMIWQSTRSRNNGDREKFLPLIKRLLELDSQHGHLALASALSSRQNLYMLGDLDERMFGLAMRLPDAQIPAVFEGLKHWLSEPEVNEEGLEISHENLAISMAWVLMLKNKIPLREVVAKLAESPTPFRSIQVVTWITGVEPEDPKLIIFWRINNILQKRAGNPSAISETLSSIDSILNKPFDAETGDYSSATLTTVLSQLASLMQQINARDQVEKQANARELGGEAADENDIWARTAGDREARSEVRAKKVNLQDVISQLEGIEGYGPAANEKRFRILMREGGNSEGYADHGREFSSLLLSLLVKLKSEDPHFDDLRDIIANRLEFIPEQIDGPDAAAVLESLIWNFRKIKKTSQRKNENQRMLLGPITQLAPKAIGNMDPHDVIQFAVSLLDEDSLLHLDAGLILNEVAKNFSHDILAELIPSLQNAASKLADDDVISKQLFYEGIGNILMRVDAAKKFDLEAYFTQKLSDGNSSNKKTVVFPFSAALTRKYRGKPDRLIVDALVKFLDGDTESEVFDGFEVQRDKPALIAILSNHEASPQVIVQQLDSLRGQLKSRYAEEQKQKSKELEQTSSEDSGIWTKSASDRDARSEARAKKVNLQDVISQLEGIEGYSPAANRKRYLILLREGGKGEGYAEHGKEFASALLGLLTKLKSSDEFYDEMRDMISSRLVEIADNVDGQDAADILDALMWNFKKIKKSSSRKIENQRMLLLPMSTLALKAASPELIELTIDLLNETRGIDSDSDEVRILAGIILEAIALTSPVSELAEALPVLFGMRDLLEADIVSRMQINSAIGNIIIATRQDKGLNWEDFFTRKIIPRTRETGILKTAFFAFSAAMVIKYRGKSDRLILDALMKFLDGDSEFDLVEGFDIHRDKAALVSILSNQDVSSQMVVEQLQSFREQLKSRYAAEQQQKVKGQDVSAPEDTGIWTKATGEIDARSEARTDEDKYKKMSLEQLIRSYLATEDDIVRGFRIRAEFDRRAKNAAKVPAKREAMRAKILEFIEALDNDPKHSYDRAEGRGFDCKAVMAESF